MRLWTLHPEYLDSQGLVAIWREALLAQKVLTGETRGYRNHPQLARFRAHPRPQAAIAAFLWGIFDEAERRGFHFEKNKIILPLEHLKIEATSGQLNFEWEHLMKKLRVRSPELAIKHSHIGTPRAHPIFLIIEGPVAE